MKTIFISAAINTIDTKIINGYFIGALIALLILGYLLFALLKPEKF